MKNFYLAVPLALAMSGCVDDPPDIQIFNAYVPSSECVVAPTGAGSAGGSLDIATSPRYLVGFALRATQASTEIVVSDSPITGGGDANAIYVTHVELSYEALGPGPRLTGAVYPGHIVLPSSATTNSTVVLDLLGATAYQELLTQLAPGTTASIGVRVKLIGKTVTGSKAESNEVVYPVQFYNSGFTCPPGTTLLSNGPCGGPGGQDGFAPECTEPEEEE